MTQDHALPVANAPCSWGALEFDGIAGEQIPYPQMLDELRASGYVGTELGDWGYMPTTARLLKEALQQRHLAMVGAFVPVALKYQETHAAGEAEAVKAARLLAAVADRSAGKQAPLLILADANGTDPVRTLHAGRVTSAMSLSSDEWKTFVRGAERIARTVRDETGLLTAFHHHCAGYIETPQEIARFLDLASPDLLGLVFDTGHYLYGCGTNVVPEMAEVLDRFQTRLLHVHFKDCQPRVAQEARANGWDYFMALRHGIFCELGKGSVPFPEVVSWLRKQHYQGWIVVEQDILPGMGSPLSSAQRNRSYLESIGL